MKVDPRIPDPRFPDRPTHGDFAIISEAIQHADERLDSGEATFESIVSSAVDPDSLLYAAVNRIGIAIERSEEPETLGRNARALAEAAFIDGFMVGVEFARKRTEE